VAFKSNYSSDTDWSYKKFPYAHEKEVTDAEALKLGETHFSSLIMKTEDTWLLLFVPAQPGDGNKQARTTFSSIWDAVAKKMRGYLSVGFSVVPLEMWSNPQWAKEMGLSSEESYNPSEDGEDKPQVYKMKLILGTRDRPAKMMTQAKILKAYGMDLDYDLVRTNINNICKFAYETMKNTTGTKEGGVSSTTAKVKRLHEEGEKHAYEVLKQQPYHPEMIGLLTTSLRAMNKTATHDSALEYFEKKFQPLFRNITKGEPAHGMSRVGLASAYHKLADAAGEIGDLDMAIRILERSLNLAPGYQKSLADLAMNYITLNESAKVEQTVARAEENGMPRTHQKFEIVHAYLSDLERNKTGGYTDEEEKEQVEGTYTGQSVEGGGGGGGGGEAAYGGGGSGSGSQGQEEQYQRGGSQDDQYGSPYGGASEEGGFSREGHSLRLDR
jgi:tetratricopeptide (TPR) repeat protein